MIIITKRRLRKLFDRWYKKAKLDNCDDYYYHGASNFLAYLYERAIGFDGGELECDDVSRAVSAFTEQQKRHIKWAEDLQERIKRGKAS